MTEQNVTSTEVNRDEVSINNTLWRVKVSVITLIGIALALVIIPYIFRDDGGFLGPEQPLPIAETAVPLLQPQLIAVKIDGEDTGRVYPRNPPQLLEINNFRIPISSYHLSSDDEILTTTALPADEATWLEDTIVNYIIRLPAGRGYRDVLESAVTSSVTITLTTAQGNVFPFSITKGELMPTGEVKPFLQQIRPAITLIWIGADSLEVSYVVSGLYSPPAQVTPPQQDAADEDSNGEEQEPLLKVELTTAIINDDAILQVSGTIKNTGANERVIEAKDIELIDNEISRAFIKIEPELPWEIAPDNTPVTFTILFINPETEAVEIRIDRRRFELSNLR